MKIKFRSEQDGDVSISITNSEFCTEVVRRFYFFMLSLGYQKDSIINAFQTVSEENETVLDNKEE